MKKTIGAMIDELSICNVKIFILENKKRDPNASDKKIADATRKTNVLNVQRTSLVDAIDITMNELADGKKQKLFGSNKSYGNGK